ncbi:putative proline-rich receptor-like protein kinase PERK13 [Iris pallida]|uniref:Proline-rich receptor-like protein kinase PERK13 n=1 Tax=Iris pallida TaxID=29817 RepID=A0AAX6FUQ5_IRIPA|nr:putative proline-rich receptor-like protein kinase PERK13 [Iris pallida]
MGRGRGRCRRGRLPSPSTCSRSGARSSRSRRRKLRWWCCPVPAVGRMLGRRRRGSSEERWGGTQARGRPR